MGWRDGSAWSDSSMSDLENASVRSLPWATGSKDKMASSPIPENGIKCRVDSFVTPPTRRLSTARAPSDDATSCSEAESACSSRRRGSRHGGTDTETSDCEDMRAPRGRARTGSSHSAGTCLLFAGIVVSGLVGSCGLLAAFGVLPVISLSMHDSAVESHFEALAAGTPAHNVRVIHLSLAGSERKVRFGLAREMSWQSFMQGVQMRFELHEPPARIETSEGLPLHSSAELQHRDNLVVYEAPSKAEAEQLAAIEAWTPEDVVSFFLEINLSGYVPMVKHNGACATLWSNALEPRGRRTSGF